MPFVTGRAARYVLAGNRAIRQPMTRAQLQGWGARLGGIAGAALSMNGSYARWTQGAQAAAVGEFLGAVLAGAILGFLAGRVFALLTGKRQ